MNKETLLGLARHVATFVAGLLVANGTIDAETGEQVGGVVLGLVGIIFSVLNKRKQVAA
jgi:hypothetical protein